MNNQHHQLGVTHAPLDKFATAQDAHKHRMKEIRFLRLSLNDQIMFAKRLAMLVKGGMPLLAGLKMMKKQAKTKSSSKIIEILCTDVENGSYLSASLQQFNKIFGDFAVNLIHVGEVSGTLDDNLAYLADALKKKQALRRKVINAMVYPIVIITATLGITGLLTLYLFPKILPIFSSFDFELPWTTKALIGFSALITGYGLYIFLGLVLLAIGFVFAMKNKKFKYKVHRIILSLPVIGNLAQGYQLANICRTYGILLKSDVQIVEAAKITAGTTSNIVYHQELLHISEKLSRGEKLSDHMLDKEKLFPPVLTQMLAVGESTGNLIDTLIYLSEMYENEVDDTTKNLSTVLEPALMVFVGLVVGFIAVSIITPIYEITQYLKP
jgi:type IV pilus assembly protein PilC